MNKLWLRDIKWKVTRWYRLALGASLTSSQRRIFWNNTKSAVSQDWRLMSMVIGAFAAFIFLFIVWPIIAVYLAYGHPHVTKQNEAKIWKDFERAAVRSRGVAMRDSQDRLVGVLTSSFETDHLGELSGRSEFSGFILHPDHKTIPLQEVPEYYWRCLVYHEDKNRGTWDSPHGVSFTGTLAIPYRSIRKSAKELRPRFAAGGSTLEMQLVRSIHKTYAHNSDRVDAKLTAWTVAPVLRRALGGKHDSPRLKSWIGQHFALVQAAGGEQDVYGVEAAGRLVFGRTAAELDPAEQLVLSAMVKAPLRLRQSKAQRQEALLKLIGTIEKPARALQCTSKNAILSSDGLPVFKNREAAEHARARLLKLHLEDIPVVDPDLKPYISSLLNSKAGPRLDPQRVANSVVSYGAQSEIVAAISDRLDLGWQVERNPWRGQVSELKLTLDIPKNLDLAVEVNSAVEALELEASSRVPPVLLKGTLTTPSRALRRFDSRSEAAQTVPFLKEKKATVPLMAAVADEQGRIVRFINTGQDALYFGGAIQRRDIGSFGNGRYIKENEFRPTGSIGKIVGAMLLAESRRVSAETIVSNRCPDGIQDRCMNPVTFRGGVSKATFEKVMAESLNAGMINILATEITKDRIREIANDLDLNIPRAHERTHPATNLTLGNYTARPLALHTLMGASLAYAEGNFDSQIPIPHIIESWQRFDPETDTYTGNGMKALPVRNLSLAEIVDGGDNKMFARVMSAPICYKDKEFRASLRRLRKWCARSNNKVRLHLSKTGTVPAPPKNKFDESDWWITGAVRFEDGRAYTYVVAAGIGDQSIPFASRGGAGWMSTIVDTLLTDIYENG